MSAGAPRRRIGVRPEAVPPDAGLQAERTSLSWARTWAVVTVNIILVAKLIAETSWVWAAVFATLIVVPLLALLRVQLHHEQRVGRFVRAGEVQQTQARYNIGLVAMVLVMAGCGLTAVLIRVLS
jgi:cobalamin synthase